MQGSKHHDVFDMQTHKRQIKTRAVDNPDQFLKIKKLARQADTLLDKEMR